jgi:archaellum biogenesis ATPase FlaH
VSRNHNNLNVKDINVKDNILKGALQQQQQSLQQQQQQRQQRRQRLQRLLAAASSNTPTTVLIKAFALRLKGWYTV